jgi:hypothetical protein
LRKLGIGCLVVLGALVLLVAIGSMLPETEESKRNRKRTRAIAACQVEVQGRLKSPSSASFPDSYASRVIESSDGVFAVSADVEAKNVFGVMLRKRWLCEVRVDNQLNSTVQKAVILE